MIQKIFRTIKRSYKMMSYKMVSYKIAIVQNDVSPEIIFFFLKILLISDKKFYFHILRTFANKAILHY